MTFSGFLIAKPVFQSWTDVSYMSNPCEEYAFHFVGAVFLYLQTYIIINFGINLSDFL